MVITFPVPLIDIFGGISVPCVRSVFSKSVGKEEQGDLLSFLDAVICQFLFLEQNAMQGLENC